MRDHSVKILSFSSKSIFDYDWFYRWSHFCLTKEKPCQGGYLTGLVGGGNEGKEETSFLCYIFKANNVPFGPVKLTRLKTWICWYCESNKNYSITVGYIIWSQSGPWLNNFIIAPKNFPSDQHFRQNFDTRQYFHCWHAISGQVFALTADKEIRIWLVWGLKK